MAELPQEVRDIINAAPQPVARVDAPVIAENIQPDARGSRDGTYGLTPDVFQSLFSVANHYKKLSLCAWINSPLRPSHPSYGLIRNKVYIAYLYARGRAALNNIQTANTVDVMAMGEFLAFDLPNGYYNNNDDAMAAITAVVRSMLAQQAREGYTTMTNEEYQGFPAISDGTYADRHQMPADWPPTAEQIAALTVNQAFKYLVMFARYPVAPAQPQEIRLVANYLVCIAKRGIVSRAFTQKIENGFQADINLPVNVTVELVRSAWEVYGRQIDPANFGRHFVRLNNEIPPLALRMRITIQQTINSGLTCFTICKEAMRYFPDFRWDAVATICHPQMENLTNAARVIADDAYYGFRSDLGAAKSTNYKDIAWVSRQLLVALRGMASLGQYAGLPQVSTHAATLQPIINAYVTAFPNRVVDPQPRNQASVHVFNAEVANWQNYTI